MRDKGLFNPEIAIIRGNLFCKLAFLSWHFDVVLRCMFHPSRICPGSILFSYIISFFINFRNLIPIENKHITA